MNRIRGVIVYISLGLSGGLIYCLLELLYRGRTHLSMLLTGGLCVLLLYVIAAKSGVPAWRKWLAAGVLISTVEFLTGVVVNLLLGLNVWDYSTQKWNLLGQICVSFSLLWLILSVPVIWLLKLADRRLIRVFITKGGTYYDGIDSNRTRRG